MGYRLTTAAYNYTAIVTSYTDSTSSSTSVPIRVLVAGERTSYFGAGWAVAGLQRLHIQADGSIVLTDGTGTVQYYAAPCTTAPCSFASPRGEFSVLSKHTSWGDTTLYDRHSPNGDVVAFYANGYEAYAKDRFGNTTTFGYDGSMHLSSVTDPAGKVTTIATTGTSSAGGPLIQITDPMSRVTSLSLDTLGNLVKIQDPAGGLPFQATYFSSRLIHTWTDRRGGVWTPDYDCAAHYNGVLEPAMLVNGSSVNPRFYVDDKDVQSTACSSAINGFRNGLGTTKANAAPSLSPDSIRTTLTSASGVSTKYAVDYFGAPTRIEDALNSVTIITRDSAGRPTVVKSPNGHTVRYSYSAQYPNLNQVHDSTTGREINFAYDSTNYDLLVHQWGNTAEVVNTLDTGHRAILTTSVAPAGTTTFATDTHGRVSSVTDPLSHVTTYTFLGSGLQNLSSVTAATLTTSITQDVFGRDSMVTTPDGHHTTTLYDVLNRQRAVIGPMLDTTRFDYDSLFLVGVHDPINQSYAYSRNALGLAESVTDPAGNAELYGFTVDGDVQSYRNRRGQTFTYVYDSLQRLTAVDTAGSAIATFGYDPSFRFAASHNSNGTDTTWIDAAERDSLHIMWRAGHRFARRLTYNADDNPISMLVSPWSTTLAWHYDTAQRVDTLTNIDGKKTAIQYNQDWGLDTLVLPTTTPLTIGRSYSASHTPSQVTYSGSTAQTLFGVWFAYDSLGRVAQRITSVTPSIQGRQYSYDPLGRLTGYATFNQTSATNICSDPMNVVDPVTGLPCNVSGTTTISDTTAFAYDKVGNRTDSSAVVTAGNRLVRFRGDSMTYDVDGNLTRRWTIAGGGFDQHLFWNQLGELDSATGNGYSSHFTYDANGMRATQAVTPVSAGGAIRVTPDHMNGWAFVDDSTGGACASSDCAMVEGPGPTPLGTGSALLSTTTNGAKALVFNGYHGTPFVVFPTLKYYARRTSPTGSTGPAIQVQIVLDYDLTDTTTGDQGRIVFVPPSASATTNTWQLWNALSSTVRWYGTHAMVPRHDSLVANPCVISSPCTTTQFITAFPNSGMHPTLGAFIFSTGTGVAGFSGNIDSVAIGFTGAPTVYDFESIGTTTTVSLWDSGDLLATVDTAGNRIEEYTDYPGDVDTPHSVRRWSGGTSALYYYPLEFPGHAMGLIDTTGAVVNWYKYGPFGAMQDSIVGVPNVLRFGARELDASGLYYFRARYYDPSIERFVQEDPIGIGGGINTYAFGGGDPVNFRDPSGLSPGDCPANMTCLDPVTITAIRKIDYDYSMLVNYLKTLFEGAPTVAPIANQGGGVPSPAATDATRVADPASRAAVNDRLVCTAGLAASGYAVGNAVGRVAGGVAGAATLSSRYAAIGGLVGGIALGPEAAPAGYSAGRLAGVIVGIVQGARAGGTYFGVAIGAVGFGYGVAKCQ